MSRHFFARFAVIQMIAMPLCAQDFYTPSINVVFDFASQSALTNSINQNGADQIERSNSNQPNLPNSSTQKKAPISFEPNFIPSKSVRKKNLANFVAKTRITDPAQADKMEALFASGDIIGQIDGMMQAKGLSISNTADAYAVWWVNAWEAANNVNSGESSSRQLQAVSAQAARAFSASSQFASASDAQKQEMAEAMLIQAALIDASKEDYAGDANLMQKLADAVKQGAKRSGLDLDAMTLTEDGFVAVKGRKTGAEGSTDTATNPVSEPTAVAANDAGDSDTGKWALIAAAGGAGLAGVFLFGKTMGKKG